MGHALEGESKCLHFCLFASFVPCYRTFYNDELEASDQFYRNQPQVLQLCYALYNILAARYKKKKKILIIVLSYSHACN